LGGDSNISNIEMYIIIIDTNQLAIISSGGGADLEWGYCKLVTKI